MTLIADVAACASRAAARLIFPAALLVPPALAQPTPATPAGTVPMTTVAAVAPVTLPAAVLAPAGKALQAPGFGETALTLEVGTGLRAVPPSRITVPVGETLLVTGPGFAHRAVQWLKDGRPLFGATGTLLAIRACARPTPASINSSPPSPTGPSFPVSFSSSASARPTAS